MAQDYAKQPRRKRKPATGGSKPAKRANTRKSTSKGSSHWPWMLAGVALGVVLMSMTRFWEAPAEDIASVIEEIAGEMDVAPVKPRFDFYTILRDSEVTVDGIEQRPSRVVEREARQEEGSKVARSQGGNPQNSHLQNSRLQNSKPQSKAKPPVPSQQSGDIFMLQAGSFRNARDADNLRARLLLLNLNVHLEKASTRPGETLHRVIVGPFQSDSKLASARVTLAHNGIDNLLLTR